MAVELETLNAEKDANFKESAANKVKEAAEMTKKKHPIMHKKPINRIKCFLGSKQNPISTPSMVLSVFRMLGCDNTFIISLRRTW